MSRIFLSHASADDREAIALKRWLAEQNPRLANEIFLDLDPDAGIRTGERWADASYVHLAALDLPGRNSVPLCARGNVRLSHRAPTKRSVQAAVSSVRWRNSPGLRLREVLPTDESRFWDLGGPPSAVCRPANGDVA